MAFTEHNHNGLLYDTADCLDAVGGIVHAFSTRLGGVSPAPYDSLNFAGNNGDSDTNILENYRLLGEAAGFDGRRVVGCRQIHSGLVCTAQEQDAGKILWNERVYEADALITDIPELPLAAFGADCCILTLYDPTAHCIAAVHAGWRGTACGIVRNTVEAMVSTYGANVATLRAAIGPAIGQCCFATDRDVYDVFSALHDPEIDTLMEMRGEKCHIDLKGINRTWLLRCGVKAAHIDIHPMCTKCHSERYWSHRLLGNRRGGMVAVIVLRKELP